MYSVARILRAIKWLLFGSPSQKRRVRQELARISASLFGDYYISDDYKLWMEDSEFRSIYNKLSPGNPYSQDRKNVIREFARMVRGVDGDLAECGCYEGVSAWFMANELPSVHLHLFDSFAGLSEPAGEDQAHSDSYFSWNAGDLCAPESKVRENLATFNSITIYKGWIPERFHEVQDLKFRLVHIDVDLYQPTKDSIEFFFPRMSKGGVMIFDDYGMTSCPGAYKAVEDYMQDKSEYVLSLPTGQGVVIKA